ncbi:chlorophyll A-B binding protein [Aureococcus anophagefferens]|uniref:Chlorophyll A-B binding protein n=1 Tax=Aureococcus anophagefferens TaxID=44056 RepID=A0ABR1FRN7_AURAN
MAKLALALLLAPAVAFQAPASQKASFSDILKDGMGFAAINNIPKFGLFQIVAFGFIAETAAMPATQSRTPRPARQPRGELQNGRAAMLGVTGAMMHSQLDSCDHHFFYPITHN